MAEQIVGKLVDEFSRCVHWHGEKDIIALKFKCCPDVYYPCYSCHNEINSEDHVIEKYDIHNDKDKNLIICGICKTEMTFEQYKTTDETNLLKCYNCKSPFNPGCKYHYNLYFENCGAEACSAPVAE